METFISVSINWSVIELGHKWVTPKKFSHRLWINIELFVGKITFDRSWRWKIWFVITMKLFVNICRHFPLGWRFVCGFCCRVCLLRDRFVAGSLRLPSTVMMFDSRIFMFQSNGYNHQYNFSKRQNNHWYSNIEHFKSFVNGISTSKSFQSHRNEEYLLFIFHKSFSFFNFFSLSRSLSLSQSTIFLRSVDRCESMCRLWTLSLPWSKKVGSIIDPHSNARLSVAFMK